MIWKSVLKHETRNGQKRTKREFYLHLYFTPIPLKIQSRGTGSFVSLKSEFQERKVGVWARESQRRENGLKRAAHGCPKCW